MNFVDCHCHLTDSRWEESLFKKISEAQDFGIDFFMQGGIDLSEWQRQVELEKEFPLQIGFCFGLHPCQIVSLDSTECNGQLDHLARWVPQALALGELGLDFRSAYGGESSGIRDLQMDIFSQQLEIARWSHKPVILHIVHAHPEALGVLDLYFPWEARSMEFPREQGMIHSFNGGWELAQEYLRRGFLISVGAAILYSKNRKLYQTLQNLPLEKLLIESDAPDQPPPKLQGKLNNSLTVIDVAEAIGHIRGLTTKEVLTIVATNFKRLMKLK